MHRDDVRRKRRIGLVRIVVVRVVDFVVGQRAANLQRVVAARAPERGDNSSARVS